MSGSDTQSAAYLGNCENMFLETTSKAVIQIEASSTELSPNFHETFWIQRFSNFFGFSSQ